MQRPPDTSRWCTCPVCHFIVLQGCPRPMVKSPWGRTRPPGHGGGGGGLRATPPCQLPERRRQPHELTAMRRVQTKERGRGWVQGPPRMEEGGGHRPSWGGGRCNSAKKFRHGTSDAAPAVERGGHGVPLLEPGPLAEGAWGRTEGGWRVTDRGGWVRHGAGSVEHQQPPEKRRAFFRVPEGLSAGATRDRTKALSGCPFERGWGRGCSWPASEGYAPRALSRPEAPGVKGRGGALRAQGLRAQGP